MGIKKVFNDNFNKGVSTFQIFLMVIMLFGTVISNHEVILFSMTVCLIGYLEPNTERFSIKSHSSKA